MTHSSNKPRLAGVDFLVDPDGHRKAVVIDLRRHRILWEQFYEAVLARERERERLERLERLDEIRRKVLETW